MIDVQQEQIKGREGISFILAVGPHPFTTVEFDLSVGTHITGIPDANRFSHKSEKIVFQNIRCTFINGVDKIINAGRN